MQALIIMLFLSAAFATDAMASAQGAIIKQKARNIANQNNANQGVTPAQPTRPAAPAAPTPQVAAPKVNEAKQQNINQLAADLMAIKPKSVATAEQKQQLIKDLQAAAEGTKKPSTESINKLVNDLSAAWAEQTLSASEQTYLAKDLNLIMNSGNLPASESQSALNRIQTILKYSGMAKAGAQKINNDLASMAAEMRK